jgi:hypothetical protein
LQDAIEDANDTARISTNEAIALYAIAMAGCITLSLLTFLTPSAGVGGAICALGATATFSTALITIQVLRNSSIENARDTHDFALAAAEFELEACLNNFDCCEDGCVTCE